MIVILKNEIDRILNSWGYITALLIGMVIVITQFILVIIPQANGILHGFSGNVNTYPFSAYLDWFLFDDRHPYMFLFLMILPILSTLPHGGSYHYDLKTGYIKMIYTRVSRKKYLIVKYITTFVAGGMVVIIPLFISLLLTKAALPSLVPVMNGLFKLSGNRVMADLYYSNTSLYIGIYFLLYFLYAGSFATISLTVSSLFNYSFFVMLTPFGVYYSLNLISTYIKSKTIYSFGPQQLLYLTQISKIRMEVLILEPIIICIVAFLIYWIRGLKYDIL